MKVEIGYFYFIKDEFFDLVKDKELMQNKENNVKRPCYFCFRSKQNDKIIWFIPISTKVKKYQKIYNDKINKQIELGKRPSIDTLVFGYVSNVYSTFLIQNMFPVTEEYISSQYMKKNQPIKLSNKLQNEVISKANKVLLMYNNGMKRIIFPSVDKILDKLIKLQSTELESMD